MKDFDYGPAPKNLPEGMKEFIITDLDGKSLTEVRHVVDVLFGVETPQLEDGEIFVTRVDGPPVILKIPY